MATVAEALGRFNARIEWVRTAPSRARAEVAARVQATLRADATTKRGNVPSFEPGGPAIPITATPVADGVRVRAVDWVMKKARERGQAETWKEIATEEIAREIAKGGPG